MPRNPAAAIARQPLLSVPGPASFSLSLKAEQPQELEPLGQTNTCQYKRLREMEQEGPGFPRYVIFSSFTQTQVVLEIACLLAHLQRGPRCPA